MISMKIRAQQDQTEVACLMKGTGKEIEREIIHAPAGLIRQYIECLQQNDVPAETIRKAVLHLTNAMVKQLQDQMKDMVKGGIL